MLNIMNATEKLDPERASERPALLGNVALITSVLGRFYRVFFSYIGCFIFPTWAQAYIPPGTIFPALFECGATGIQAFDALYSVSTPSPEQLAEQYHISPAHLRNSTRIIWSLAQYDPSSTVALNVPGVNAPLPSADRNVSRILYTANMVHRKDLFSPLKGDWETVIRVRAV
ncbi:uncharacterized protein PAC_16326 [Phialocephala subalpina]|uniref:Uncharacterized protein n=1 Tax=Phialocephala subalpina TaxID=576137 RepID=A0A1L7XN02_9HELO|nr:uncharacterized protein PAC_16326 [Phialocephala subalpina]